MGQAFSGGSNPADGQVNPPPGYVTPDFPSLYRPDIIRYFSGPTDGYFLYYAEDIFHFTLYWHIIFHAAIFGLTGAWFTFVALLSPTSSVGVRSPPDRRAKTDFRTNTEVAEEGALDMDSNNRLGIRGYRKGSASDNEAAKSGIRERTRRGSSSRAIHGPRGLSDPLWSREDEGEEKEDRSTGRSRRDSSADGLKIMDFAENPDDIPLRPTKSGRSGPSRSSSSTYHPKPRRHDERVRKTSVLSSHSEQSSDLEMHPTEAFSGAKDRPVRRPPRSPSPPTMEPPSPGDLALDRPISHTDVPIPNLSQYSLHREEDLSRDASMSEQRPRVRDADETARLSHDRLGPLKTFFSSSHHEDLSGMSRTRSHAESQGESLKTRQWSRKAKHSRRPAPVWLAALPFPFFAVWGLASAVIMSTIIGFTLSAVYNTAGFEMSTWVPFLWAVIEAALVIISSYSTLTSVL